MVRLSRKRGKCFCGKSEQRSERRKFVASFHGGVLFSGFYAGTEKAGLAHMDCKRLDRYRYADGVLRFFRRRIAGRGGYDSDFRRLVLLLYGACKFFPRTSRLRKRQSDRSFVSRRRGRLRNFLFHADYRARRRAERFESGV